MADGKLIKHSFEELSQSLRVLMEAHLNANRGGLLFVDRPEAVGNIETGFTSVLNAFHNLYDAIGKQLETNPIDWYKSAPLALILVIRNARHHNVANRIRTLYTYHAQEARSIEHMEEYILVDFPCSDEGADTFDLFVSWGDLNTLLELPGKISHIKNEETKLLIREYLDADKFSDYSDYYELAESRVFINIIPLIVNAAATIVPLIKNYCFAETTESSLFLDHFTSVTMADTKNHDFQCGPFVLPK
jgi:hypothetical protein